MQIKLWCSCFCLLNVHSVQKNMFLSFCIQQKLNVRLPMCKCVLHLQSNFGTVSLSYQLSDQPVFGEWIIQIIAQGQIEEATFLVEEYYQTRFEVRNIVNSFVMFLLCGHACTGLSVCELSELVRKLVFNCEQLSVFVLWKKLCLLSYGSTSSSIVSILRGLVAKNLSVCSVFQQSFLFISCQLFLLFLMTSSTWLDHLVLGHVIDCFLQFS